MLDTSIFLIEFEQINRSKIEISMINLLIWNFRQLNLSRVLRAGRITEF